MSKIYVLIFAGLLIFNSCSSNISKPDIKEVTLLNIEISTPPKKTNYFIKDKLIDITGLVVTGTYSDRTSKIEKITTINISGFDTETTGNKNIVVTVGEKKATFIICVNPNEEKINDGVGIGNIILHKSTADEVIVEYGGEYNLVEHNNYSYEMKYESKGLSFYYMYDDLNKKIFSIHIKFPFKGVANKGIVLGKSTMQEVVNVYGPPNWSTTDESQTWWSEYSGIEFHVEVEKSLPRFPLNEEVHLKKTVIEIVVD